MDITSFILGLKNGKADGGGSIYHKFAEAMLTRNCKVLTGKENVFKMQNFKLTDGNFLGNTKEYSFAGFTAIEFFRMEKLSMIGANSFYGDAKLKLLDFSNNPAISMIAFEADALNGCTALQSIVIRRDVSSTGDLIAAFKPGYDNGASADFYIYIPEAYYDINVSYQINISSGAAARMRKLEDYPSIDKWDVNVVASFYDGDELLTTRTVAFGTKPSSYTPTKPGYKFVKWEPELSAIYENTSYYAVFEPKTFAEATWEEISAVTKSGKAAEAYKVGDSKQITLNYSDGTSDTVNMVIMDFDRKNQAGEPTIILKNDILLSKKASRGTFISVGDNTIIPALPTDLQAVLTEVQQTPLFSAMYNKYIMPYSRDLGMSGDYTRGEDDYMFDYYWGKPVTSNRMCTADGTYVNWRLGDDKVVSTSGSLFTSTSTTTQYNICFLIAV